MIAVLALAYLLALTPGHALIPDDYAAYILHASNLASGRPYADIKFTANPGAMWIGPAEGYPPVFPLLLAPVYKLFGLNLWAMKLVTIICFTIFLVILVRLVSPILPLWGRIALILLVALHPVFREYGNYVMSEIPYLMFSFAALWMIDVSYRDLRPNDWHLRQAVLTAALIYLSYGTRTIGATLLPALALADLCKFKRPSRFLCLVVCVTGVFIISEMALLPSQKTYIRLTDFSPRNEFQQFIHYAKRLSYVWANGFSKDLQIGFAIITTILAALGFLRSLLKKKSATEFYLLGYVGALTVYTINLYIRGLLPLVPLYFLYALQELTRLLKNRSRTTRVALGSSLALIVAVIYGGRYREQRRIGPSPNSQDLAFQQLCVFIDDNTRSSDTVASSKPRSITLFTNRPSAALGPDETGAEVLLFLKNTQANFVVQPDWLPSSWEEAFRMDSTLIFRNGSYRVYRVGKR